MKDESASLKAAALAALCVLGAVALYVPWDSLGSGGVMAWLDWPLHASRIEVARTALGESMSVPDWSSREFLGAPFSANLHSFPLIPTRLIVLLLAGDQPQLMAILISAALSALLGWLLARELGLTPLAATLAGWTFAAAGFFSARMFAGHLTLLEAYPALPLLLWLALRSRRLRGTRREWVSLATLSVATASVVLAGHPQLPAYAIAATVAFLLLQPDRRRALRPVGAMSLGIGLSLFAWIPMLSLVGRSTRLLDLATADNDLSIPWGRLPAMLVPDFDGYPFMHPLYETKPFRGYPNAAYYWDTVGYIGLVPVVVVLGFGLHLLVRRQRPGGPLFTLAVISVVAGGLALPWAAAILDAVPGTVLRSPSRLLYLPMLGLAIALGRFVDHFLSMPIDRKWKVAGVVVIAAVHVGDLGGFSRTFVQVDDPPSMPAAARETITADSSDRAAVDRWLAYPEIADIDDVGVFDSVLLADTYRAMQSLGGLPTSSNLQYLDGSSLAVPALQRASVSHVLTPEGRSDLEFVHRFEDVTLYRVPDPVPRATFHSASQAEFVPRGELIPTSDADTDIIRLPLEADDQLSAPAGGSSGTIVHSRPNHDEISLSVSSDGGWLRVVESHDPGWTARIDGDPATIWKADGFLMGIAVPAGDRTVTLTYSTPGRRAGFLGSGLSLIALSSFLMYVRRRNLREATGGP